MEYQKINTLFKRDGDAICLNQPVNPKYND